MRVRALDRKLLRDLVRRRAQAITIAVVVASGVAVFVGPVATYRSLAWARDAFYATGRFADVFARVERAPARLADALATVPGVSVAETRIVEDVTLRFPELAEPVTGHVVSLPDDGRPRLNHLFLREGRLPAPGTDEVVLNEAFAAAHGLHPGGVVEAVLKGRARTLRVVGVASSPEFLAVVDVWGMPDDLRRGVLWMGRTEAEAAFDMEGAFSDLVLRLGPEASEPAVRDAVDRLLEPYGAVGSIGRADQASHRFVSDELSQQRVTAVLLPTIFMAVAAFLVNVVLARLVAGERMQIATLKALGYSGRRIGLHYLLFALAVVGAGALLGVGLGALMAEGQLVSYRRFFRFPVLDLRLEAWVPLTACLVSLATGAAAALGTVRGVVRLPPAQAMRPEPPDPYRQGLLERLRLHRRLSPHVLLVARSVVHRPLRAVFTSLGVALSAAILVAGLFFFDAMDVLMDVVFERAAREDVALTVYRKVPERAVSEVAHLPGVLQAEGQRLVPVRFGAGPVEVETVLMGLDREATHRRVLDIDGRAVAPPEDGVLLGAALARKLGVRAGDTVRVKILEGDFATRRLVVAGTVDDLAGLTAAMDRQALHRLMREAPAVSQVTVQLDPAEREDFFAAVRRRPLVGAVALGADAIRAFMESMGGIILAFAAVLTALAAAIAVGVVYNAARISFAERAHDLASLRVLGFTRREVSTMLLSELGVEFLVGLPVGLGLGYLLAWAATAAFTTDLFRLPLIIAPSTFGLAAAVVTASAAVSALVVRRMLDRFDLVSVLKTYE